MSDAWNKDISWKMELMSKFFLGEINNGRLT